MDDLREGGCQCGALRYRLRGEALALTVCHCTECQRQSGSAFGMSLIVPTQSFQLLTGEPKIFSRSSDSGRLVHCAFCPTCGTRIYHSPEAMKGSVNIKPGTLDDTSWLEPGLHVWTKSRQPWFSIPEGIRSFDSQPQPTGS